MRISLFVQELDAHLVRVRSCLFSIGLRTKDEIETHSFVTEASYTLAQAIDLSSELLRGDWRPNDSGAFPSPDLRHDSTEEDEDLDFFRSRGRGDRFGRQSAAGSVEPTDVFMRNFKDGIVLVALEMHRDLESIQYSLQECKKDDALTASSVDQIQFLIDRALKVNDALVAMMWSDRPPDDPMLQVAPLPTEPVVGQREHISPASGDGDQSEDIEPEVTSIGAGPAIGLMVVGAMSASMIWGIFLIVR